MRRGALAGATLLASAGLLLSALPRAAAAAEAEAWQSFSWRAPERCPDRQTVLARLDAVLRERPIALSSTEVRAEVVPAGSGWQLSLEVRVAGTRRVRQLSAASCDDLADATAVALVLLLEPLSAEAAGAAMPEPPPPPPSAPPSVPAPATKDEVVLAPEPGGAVDRHWTFGAAAILDSSALSAPALGAQLHSQLRWSAWAVEAYGVLLPARREPVEPGEFVELSHWSAGLRLCHAPWAGRAARAQACLGLEAGRFSARGAGLRQRQSEAHDPWLAPGAGARVAWRALPHATLLGGVEALVPLLKHGYSVNASPEAAAPEREVHATPAVTLRAWLGLEFDLL